MTAGETHQAIEAIFRIERARLIAGLARVVRNVDLAEELAQDALVIALSEWPRTIRRAPLLPKKSPQGRCFNSTCLDPASILLHPHRYLPIMQIQPQLQHSILTVRHTCLAATAARYCLVRFIHKADSLAAGAASCRLMSSTIVASLAGRRRFFSFPGTSYRATVTTSLAGRRGFFPLPGTSYRATFTLFLRDDISGYFHCVPSSFVGSRDYRRQAATHCSTLWRQLCCWSGPFC